MRQKQRKERANDGVPYSVKYSPSTGMRLCARANNITSDTWLLPLKSLESCKTGARVSKYMIPGIFPWSISSSEQICAFVQCSGVLTYCQSLEGRPPTVPKTSSRLSAANKNKIGRIRVGIFVFLVRQGLLANTCPTLSTTTEYSFPKEDIIGEAEKEGRREGASVEVAENGNVRLPQKPP